MCIRDRFFDGNREVLFADEAHSIKRLPRISVDSRQIQRNDIWMFQVSGDFRFAMESVPGFGGFEGVGF